MISSYNLAMGVDVVLPVEYTDRITAKYYADKMRELGAQKVKIIREEKK